MWGLPIGLFSQNHELTRNSMKWEKQCTQHCSLWKKCLSHRIDAFKAWPLLKVRKPRYLQHSQPEASRFFPSWCIFSAPLLPMQYESEDYRQARQGIKDSLDSVHRLENRHKTATREVNVDQLSDITSLCVLDLRFLVLVLTHLEYEHIHYV